MMDGEEVIFRSLIRLPLLIRVGNCDDVGEYSFEDLQQVRHDSQPDMKQNETIQYLYAVISSFQLHPVPCLLLVMGAYRGRL
jgi:hypothetical protein